MQISQPKNVFFVKALGVFLIFLWGILSQPVSVMSAPRESLVMYTAAAGALYGLGDAVLREEDLLKGCWDGFMLGAMAPGAVMGTGVGLGVGALVHGATWRPPTEKDWVGWGAAGWTVGGLVSAYSLAGDVADFGTAFPVLQLGLGGYHAVAIVNAYDLGRQSAKLPNDAARHYGVSRTLRERFDPGTALIVGAAKEAADYFFRLGIPEFRDLQNNWDGTFRLRGGY